MTDASVAAQIARFENMTTDELRGQYEDIYGERARSRNRRWLFRRVAWGYQAKIYGGLSERAKHRIEELAPTAEMALRTPRTFTRGPGAVHIPASSHPILKPGCALIRNYRGERHVVIVRDDGKFEWRDRVFRSLSALANAITGSHVSGPAFFNLKQTSKK